MSYRQEDEKELLEEFVTWLIANGYLGYVKDVAAEFLKEREEAREWGKKD